MAFTKRTWEKQSGILDRLNHIEDYLASDDGGGGTGGDSGVISILLTETETETSFTATLDKTWQEIRDAMEAGKYPYVYGYFENAIITDYVSNCTVENGVYCIYLFNPDYRLEAAVPDDYPSHVEEI